MHFRKREREREREFRSFSTLLIKIEPINLYLEHSPTC